MLALNQPTRIETVKKRALYFLLALLTLSFSSAWAAYGLSPFANAYRVSYFNAINVAPSAAMNVKIIANSKRNDVLLIGADSKKIAYDEFVSVDDGILSIKPLPKRYYMGAKKQKKLVSYAKGANENQQPTLIIRTRTLREINYAGQGNLTGIKFNTPYLDVNIDSPANVYLKGKRVGLRHLSVKSGAHVNLENVNTPDLTIDLADDSQVKFTGEASLRQLTYRGRGQIEGYWLNSPELFIIGSDEARAELAGRAGTIDVKLNHQAKLEARYLRAEHAFVKTYDYSEANVWARRTLNSHAQDDSNIYYYRDPELRAEHMADSGAVLNMIDNRYIN